MKLFFLFTITLLFLQQGSAQKLKSVEFTAKAIEKRMAKVSDSLYASRYETMNVEYGLFLQQLKLSNAALYESCRVDSTNWPLKYCEPMRTYYHRHPAYSLYPVVNVSFEGALAYCEWLTSIYNNDNKRKFRKVIFQLPTEKEWMRAAEGGRSQSMFPWANFYFRDKNGRPMCNMRYINETSVYRDAEGRPVLGDTSRFGSMYSASLRENALYTASVYSYYPNEYGIYNMSGNAAEMIREKGISKGGSWNSFGHEVMINSSRPYEGPSPELGFRVFMRVLEQ